MLIDKTEVKPRILLATVTSETARYYEFYDSVSRLIMPPGYGICQIHSSSPAKNRNIIINQVLKSNEFTHIFFMDDDHTFPSDAVLRLVAHNVDIVSGLYCMKFPPFPIIALNNPNSQNMSSFIDMTKIGPNELFEVPRVPAGCLLVSVAGLRKMSDYLSVIYHKEKRYKNTFFTIGQIQPDEWGDDLWFCDRAREAGLKIYIDSSVRVGHITKCVLTPTYMDGKWVIQHYINSDYSIDMDSAKEEIPVK